MSKVLITGGAGYVGSRLIPQLLELGHEVTVYDILYYGSGFLPMDHPRLNVVGGDLRDIEKLSAALDGIEMVIHLACISNDASFVLDEMLSETVNFDAFEPLVVAAKQAGVRRFIYASTSSVYGVSEVPNVTEDHPLVPLTLYNKFKGMCEPLLFKHQSEDFTCVTIRPATLCGYAPRQRLDLSVNILTNHAVNRGKITVFGGTQLRPNLNIQDMCDLYKLLLEIDAEKIAGQTFNAGYQNMSIMDIALLVQDIVQKEVPGREKIEIETTPSDDLRSYHINSDKITRTIGFKPRHTVEDAIRELCVAFREGKLPGSLEDDKYFNVQRMKALNAA
ncbi:MAG: SDR family oxidoreductase [Alphaproteobacteria bacterium]|nr:SDR family oxidoreductase [Alphaproteobacteria bacterium]